MLKLMDDPHTQHPIEQTPPQPPSEQAPPVPQITLSAEERANIHASTLIKRIVIGLGIITVILVFGIWSFVASEENVAHIAAANKAKKSQTTKTNTSSSASSSQNPLNSNGSVSSDVQYCSNVVNGSLYC
jgi:hypothetical protein